MNLKFGNLLDNLTQYDYVGITANSFVKNNGELVMGRGFARAMALKYPEIPSQAGYEIGLRQQYLIAPLPSQDHFTPFLFQVKIHWGDAANLGLVQKSTSFLAAFANAMAHYTFALNYPAIGNGRLSKDDIEPIITELPDNVDIWQFK